jgi:hypothetical protein
MYGGENGRGGSKIWKGPEPPIGTASAFMSRFSVKIRIIRDQARSIMQLSKRINSGRGSRTWQQITWYPGIRQWWAIKRRLTWMWVQILWPCGTKTLLLVAAYFCPTKKCWWTAGSVGGAEKAMKRLLHWLEERDGFAPHRTPKMHSIDDRVSSIPEHFSSLQAWKSRYDPSPVPWKGNSDVDDWGKKEGCWVGWWKGRYGGLGGSAKALDQSGGHFFPQPRTVSSLAIFWSLRLLSWRAKPDFFILLNSIHSF